MSFRGSLLFVVRLHTNQQSKRTSVQTTTPALAVQGQFCWKRRTSGWYNSFHELNKRQQFVGTIRNRTNGIYFLSTLISHTPTTTTTTNCRPMSTHPLIRTNNKRNKETTSTTTTSSNNTFSPSSSTPCNDERSQGSTSTYKRRINNSKTTSTSTNTSRRNNNRNTTTSMDLEQCMAQDDYNVNVIASRYGMCTIPLAISLEALVSYMIDDTITSYSTSSQMSIDLLSTLVILHSSWLLTLSKCFHDLHTQADPLSTLAQQWSGAVTTVDNNTRRSIPSFNPHDEHTPPPLYYDPFMTQEEWDDARQTNKRRLRHSFDAGLFFSVSILLASYPFLPLDVLFDDEEDEVVFLDPTISEMTLSSSDMVLDYSTLGICFIASLLTGRKAYKAWKALQHTPPTELPAKIYLRRSAAFANE